MGMSPEAQEYFARVERGMEDLFTWLHGALAALDSEDANSVDTWLKRARIAREQVVRYLGVARTLREFRRAYGHEVEEASLNVLEMRLDQLSAHLPELLEVAIDGIESSLP